MTTAVMQLVLERLSSLKVEATNIEKRRNSEKLIARHPIIVLGRKMSGFQ